jgi:DmsE family decaheme c-type cytochrome
LFIGLVLGLALTWPAVADADDTDCAGCHENLALQFGTTTHGRIAAFETRDGQTGCATCHGDGEAHMEAGGDPELIRGLGDVAEPEPIAEVCGTCHTGKALNDWVGSAHPMSDVGCTDCHTVHADPQELERPSDTCMGCHTDVQAQFNYPSHHPVREKHMSCDSCHDPHGSSINMLKNEETPQELCFTCHRAQQGPFVFEHEPVFEGCDTCHSPHGSVADNLLWQAEPFICLQCHELHFHAGLEGDDADTVDVPLYANPTNPNQYYPGGVPNPGRGASYKMAFTTKCTQCHTQVHGTDDPSQTVPGMGGGLMR